MFVLQFDEKFFAESRVFIEDASLRNSDDYDAIMNP
jgi:hypothetical protein